MVINTMATGKMIQKKEKEIFIGRKVIDMKAIGKRIIERAKVYITLMMDANMKVTGKMM